MLTCYPVCVSSRLLAGKQGFPHRFTTFARGPCFESLTQSSNCSLALWANDHLPGWEAGIRTPITAFRVPCPTIRRPPINDKPFIEPNDST